MNLGLRGKSSLDFILRMFRNKKLKINNTVKYESCISMGSMDVLNTPVYFKVAILGDSPKAMLSGGARISTFISLMEPFCQLVIVSYRAYGEELSIENNFNGQRSKEYSIVLPKNWPRAVKASIIVLWNPIQILRKKEDIEFIILSGGSTLMHILSIISAKIIGVPITYDYMDIEVEKIPYPIYRKIMLNFDIVFAISKNLFDKATSLGCRKIHYLPAFTNPDLFCIDQNKRDEIRKQWAVNQSTIIIGYAGALAETEGLSNLILAIEDLVKEALPVKLHILGSKQTLNQGKDIIDFVRNKGLGDKIIFFEPISHDAVPGFLSGCDILCSPKIDCAINRAANPIKVVEYLSMGIPTVCSNIGEVGRILEDGKNGFLVTPGNVGELRDKIRWIVYNQEIANSIAQAGRQLVISNYSTWALQSSLTSSIEESILTYGKLE